MSDDTPTAGERVARGTGALDPSVWKITTVAVLGSLLALGATPVLASLASHGPDLRVLVPALFMRGMGQGAVGLPAMSVAYESIEPRTLPMAATALNILQRLGGPTLTTICAVALGWALDTHTGHRDVNAWTCACLLLAMLHALALVAAAALPRRIEAKT